MTSGFIGLEVGLVALLAEGVDRNSTNWTLTGPSTVALLAEGVDRNVPCSTECYKAKVALLAEGVDRNIIIGGRPSAGKSRPPRGGRG